MHDIEGEHLIGHFRLHLFGILIFLTEIIGVSRLVLDIPPGLVARIDYAE